MKKLLVVLCLVPLGACVSPKSQLSASLPNLGAVDVPQPQPTKLRPVRFRVYNTGDLERLVAEQKTKGTRKLTLITLTGKGYQNLSFNLLELERYIREQKEVISYLQTIVNERGTLGTNTGQYMGLNGQTDSTPDILLVGDGA